MAATKARLYADAIRLLADARFAAITDDGEALRALDDSWDEAVTFVLRQAPWRFALVDAALATSGTTITGYANGYSYPAGWLRTYRLVLRGSDGRDHPVDVRELPTGIFANVASLRIEFVSSSFADPATTVWPEHFAQVVAAYLAFLIAERVTGEKGAAGRMSQLFSQLLGEARRIDAASEDDWLPFQRTGEMLLGARDLLQRAFWRFALKDITLTTENGTPFRGFTKSYIHPADWLRTRRLYQLAGALPYPFEIAEQGGFWSTNRDFINVQYVSSTLGADSTRWPEPFRAALLGYLKAGRPDMPAQEGERAQPEWVQAILFAEQALADPPDDWLEHQLSGDFPVAIHAVARAGFWSYRASDGTLVGLKEIEYTAADQLAGQPSYPFLYHYALPDDWLKTHSLFKPGNGRDNPINIRELMQGWSTNETAFVARYLSTDILIYSDWPQKLWDTVLAYLRWQTAPAQERDARAKEYAVLLELARQAHGRPADGWLDHQLSGAFETARRVVLQEGYWAWRGPDGVMRGLREVQYSAEADQLSDQPAYAYPYRYPLPADHFNTHALFQPWDSQEFPIAISETAHDWSTDARLFVARYVSNDVLDSVGWPDLIVTAVRARLDWRTAPANEMQARAAEYALALDAAKAAYSRGEDKWLRFQLDGSFAAGRMELLEQGRWRFAVKTAVLAENTDPLPSEEADGAVSDSYTSRFLLPNDWLRTLRVYYAIGAAPYADRIDIDYRDEQGALHANYTPVTIRYVSRLGLDSTKWPAHFRDALLALLQYQEARADPAKTNIAAAKLALYKAACREAERLDDARDMPVIRRSHLVAARRGVGLRAREEGWYWR